MFAVYCGTPVLRMRGAIANDMIQYMIWYICHLYIMLQPV